uniref:Uncharacterized protein n=1 Tax=Panagrolaimus sp. PS1159 TaxID=55785 RepID=A0AC35FQ35_9BILA
MSSEKTYTESAQEVLANARDTLAETAEAAKNKAAELASAAGEKLGIAKANVDQIGEQTKELGDRVKDKAHQ